METEPRRQLRVLLADERAEHLDQVAGLLTRLGHIVIARETDIAAVGARSEREPADVAIVAVDDDRAHAQGLISEIVREAACPVIVLIRAEDPAFIREAARRGVPNWCPLARPAAVRRECIPPSRRADLPAAARQQSSILQEIP